MLKSAYEYSDAIEAKGEDYATRSLLMSIMLEHHNKLFYFRQHSIIFYIKYILKKIEITIYNIFKYLQGRSYVLMMSKEV